MEEDKELKELQRRAREFGAKQDKNPVYQRYIARLMEKLDLQQKKYEYRKNEILNDRIPDLNKYEDE